MATVVNEPIAVGVVFKRALIKPAWFVWGRRRYVVREVTQRWQTTQGRAAILHLGVSDGDHVFELQFNASTLVWSLAAIAGDGCE